MTVCPEVRSAEVIRSLHTRIGRQGPPADEPVTMSPGITTAVEATEMMTPTGPGDNEREDVYFNHRPPPDGFAKFQY